MAERIPLNLYKRVTKTLTRVPQLIYTAPPKRASTIISALGSNITNENKRLTLALSSTEGSFNILSDTVLEPLDYVNLLPSKIVLSENDSIVITTDIFKDLATINDEGLFWLYDIPTEPTNIDLQLRVQAPTQIIIDWGTIDGTSNTTLTGNNTNQDIPFYYNESIETGTSINLSILESNNTSDIRNNLFVSNNLEDQEIYDECVEIESRLYFRRLTNISNENKNKLNNFIHQLKTSNLWKHLVEAWILNEDYNLGTGTTAIALKNEQNEGILSGAGNTLPTWEVDGIRFYEGYTKPNFNTSRMLVPNWAEPPLRAPMSIACVYTPFSSPKPGIPSPPLGPGACLFGQTSLGGGPGQHFGMNYGFTLSAVDFYYGSNSIEKGTFFSNVTGGPDGPYYMSSMAVAPGLSAYASTNTRSFLLTSDYSSNTALTAVAFSHSLNGGLQNHEFDGIISAGFVFSSAIDHSTFYNIYKNTIGENLNFANFS